MSPLDGQERGDGVRRRAGSVVPQHLGSPPTPCTALPPVPPTTAVGALVHHITGGAEARTFQPMNVNFGLFPPLPEARGGRRGRTDRYKGYTDRAKADWLAWLGEPRAQAAE